MFNFDPWVDNCQPGRPNSTSGGQLPEHFIHFSDEI